VSTPRRRAGCSSLTLFEMRQATIEI